jgi:hypothetical protein
MIINKEQRAVTTLVVWENTIKKLKFALQNEFAIAVID